MHAYVIKAGANFEQSLLRRLKTAADFATIPHLISYNAIFFAANVCVCTTCTVQKCSEREHFCTVSSSGRGKRDLGREKLKFALHLDLDKVRGILQYFLHGCRTYSSA